MGTKINHIRQQIPFDGIMLTSWFEKSGISRSEISDYTKSGWLRRISTGVYFFVGDNPTLYGILASYQSQSNLTYHIGASSALELRGYSHYVPMGKPKVIVFSPIRPRLPKWIGAVDLDMTLVEESTKVFGDIGIEHIEYGNLILNISSPERAIMECLVLTHSHYDMMDVYYLMEMLTTLRHELVQRLLERCTSVKVKRLFLYMAEKTQYGWFDNLDLTKISLGSGTRSFSKGGVKNAKYNIVISKELDDFY